MAETVVSAFCVKSTALMEARMVVMGVVAAAPTSAATLRLIPFYT